MSSVNALRANAASGRNAPSPTNTAFSGISNYRSDAYRREPTGRVPPTPQIDGRTVAAVHFEELSIFLANHMAKEPVNSRSNAREKLTRLTRQQFQELSTDVYDELVRRKENNSRDENSQVPFLPLRDEFHPKRNQARQKLATLPKIRFKDLSSDVFVELGRRYPELKEGETPDPNTPGSVYEEPQPLSPSSADGPQPSAPSPFDGGRRPSRDQDESRRSEVQSTYSNTSASHRRPSQDQNEPIPPSPMRQASDDSEGLAYRRSSPENPAVHARRPSANSIRSYDRRPSQETNTYSAASRRRPSQDNGGPGYQPVRRPSQESSALSSQGPSSATTGVIIPNKSTIAEEEIQVPFGEEEQDFASSGPESRSDSREGVRISVTSGSTGLDRDGLRGADRETSKSPLDRLGQVHGAGFGLGGLNALAVNASLGVSEDEAGNEQRAGSEYYDKMSLGRASVASDFSTKGGRTRQSVEDVEKLRREYEFKIATMQSRISSLESVVADHSKAAESDSITIQNLKDEIDEMRENAANHASTAQRLEAELHEALSSKENETQRADANANIIEQLKTRLEVAERDREDMDGPDSEAVESLREEVQGLLDALRDMSNRNEEMMTDKDADMALIQTLNTQVKDYRRKYEQAKTELRNTKATSQLFSGPQVPKVDERRLPLAENGVILDIHITSFQGAIDTLLSLARSDNPTSVLTSMKNVVHAVTAITDDVKAFERHTRHDRPNVNEDTARHLRERADATLSNLVSAARNHATSYGLSPVSLMDAAASHVSVSVIELVKLLSLRKSTRAERDSAMSPTDGMPQSFTPMRTVDEARVKASGEILRTASSGSNRPREDVYVNNNTRNRQEMNGPPISDRSSASQSPPPPQIFDPPDNPMSNGGVSDGSMTVDSADDAWSELKPYLDAQSESIVYSIQSLLSSIRAGAQANELNENLTQIITIVSSIVAVCKDSLPSASVQIGTSILHELSEQCNILSEMQSLAEINKSTRQAMASASFSVAKAMKELMKL